MTARIKPTILVADDWQDYRLLDSGAGAKLEQVGPYRFVRPEPQALWPQRAVKEEWERADAVFASAASDEDEAGKWRFNTTLPETWPLRWNDITFLSRPTPFRHLAFFPEHSVHWRYARECVRAAQGAQPEVLNLFAYTGLASLACASAGARVTHVDASKRAIAFAKENQQKAGLDQAPIRWILDDAFAFVQREIRRGRHYHGIILDPPKFGRGPNGETWRIEEQLEPLLAACCRLLRPDGFMIATVYAVRLSFLALAETALDAFEGAGGTWEFGEMTLPHAGDERLLPTAIFARWRS